LATRAREAEELTTLSLAANPQDNPNERFVQVKSLSNSRPAFFWQLGGSQRLHLDPALSIKHCQTLQERNKQGHDVLARICCGQDEWLVVRRSQRSRFQVSNNSKPTTHRRRNHLPQWYVQVLLFLIFLVHFFDVSV
jgi:hypothetical protein